MGAQGHLNDKVFAFIATKNISESIGMQLLLMNISFDPKRPGLFGQLNTRGV